MEAKITIWNPRKSLGTHDIEAQTHDRQTLALYCATKNTSNCSAYKLNPYFSINDRCAERFDQLFSMSWLRVCPVWQVEI